MQGIVPPPELKGEVLRWEGVVCRVAVRGPERGHVLGPPAFGWTKIETGALLAGSDDGDWPLLA